jgi:hypothetical protein
VVKAGHQTGAPVREGEQGVDKNPEEGRQGRQHREDALEQRRGRLEGHLVVDLACRESGVTVEAHDARRIGRMRLPERVVQFGDRAAHGVQCVEVSLPTEHAGWVRAKPFETAPVTARSVQGIRHRISS